MRVTNIGLTFLGARALQIGPKHVWMLNDAKNHTSQTLPET